MLFSHSFIRKRVISPATTSVAATSLALAGCIIGTTGMQQG
jgi:hypothetical protein